MPSDKSAIQQLEIMKDQLASMLVVADEQQEFLLGAVLARAYAHVDEVLDRDRNR